MRNDNEVKIQENLQHRSLLNNSLKLDLDALHSCHVNRPVMEENHQTSTNRRRS